MTSQPISRIASPSETEEWTLDRLTELVDSLIGMMNSGNMSRMEIEYGALRLSLRAHGDSGTTGVASIASDVTSVEEATASQSIEHAGTHVVTAPMIGTFYTSPAPGEPPFVSPGDRIDEGQTIGIIEAMKIMNEIASDRSGVIIELLAGNSQSVEFGSPLVRLDPVAS